MWSWFHFTVNDILLFQSWKIDTTWKMIISCTGIYLLGILLEAIKLVRKKFDSKSSTKSSLTTNDTTFMKIAYRQMFQIGLFMIQLIINYLLMLIFMSYSIWFGTAVIFGITTGSYVFA
uniref:Copper transport protein n=1 Tax=Onchocerca volvulus TaxID=6282 RepID=A0A8R1XRQ8_ONCVO